MRRVAHLMRLLWLPCLPGAGVKLHSSMQQQYCNTYMQQQRPTKKKTLENEQAHQKRPCGPTIPYRLGPGHAQGLVAPNTTVYRRVQLYSGTRVLGVPFGILLAIHIDWRSWHIVLVPHNWAGSQLL